jgi:hypothetical protein
MGQLLGIYIGHRVSNKLDADPKRWRMFAGFATDISSFLEILTPLFPRAFVVIGALANAGIAAVHSVVRRVSCSH